MRRPITVLTFLLYTVAPWATDCLAEGYRVRLSVGIHQYILDNSVDYDGYSVAAPVSSLAGATRLIAKKDDHSSSCTDFPVCLNILANGVSGFGVSQSTDFSLNPVLPDEASAADWLINTTGPPNHPNIKVVKSITYKGNADDGVAAVDPRFSCALTLTATDDTWAHEFGHMCGLAEGSDVLGLCGYNLMRSNTVQYRDQLTEVQADLVINNLSAADPVLVSPGTVSCAPMGVAAFEDISATAVTGGVQISFATIWEIYTASFEVRRVDSQNGNVLYSLGTVGGTPDSDLKKYLVTDANGTVGSVYKIIEHQQGGRGDLTTGPVIAEAAVGGGGGASYNADSLAAVVTVWGNGPQIAPDPCLYVPQYAILCPDSFATALGSYATLWRNRGVSAQVVTETQIDTCIKFGYREYIQYAAHRGTKFFLLVGDANDRVMWDDSSRWVNGWHFPSRWNYQGGQFVPGPHIPSQPEKNLIPTFYTAVTDSPQTSWTYYTPYYPSDLPYADLDGDSLPDVAIGRLPASSVADINAYSAKLSAWLSATNGNLGAHAALLSYAVNHGVTPGWPTAMATDSLRNAFPSSTQIVQAGYTYFSDPVWGSFFSDSIKAIANAAASGGADVIAWNLNSSDRYEYTGFWRVSHMNEALPISTTNRPFISVALSCGMNDFERTEQREYYTGVPPGPYQYFNPIRPIVERLLFNPSGGAIAQVGPTRASFTLGNPLFGEEFLRRLYAPGGTVGTAFLLAQRLCMTRYPQYRDLFKSYVLLGDPRLGPNVVTGVAGASPEEMVRFSLPAPNPFNPTTRLRFFLGSAANATITIFDVQGRLVRHLLRDARYRPGWSEVRWDGSNDWGGNVSSGIYFARFITGGTVSVQRLVLLR